MTMRPPKTPRQREVLALHNAGRTASEIATALCISDTRAREVLARLGVRPQRRANRWPVSPRRTNIDVRNAAQREAVAQRRAQIAAALAADPSLTHGDLARRHGVSEATIRSDRAVIDQPSA